MNKVPEDIAQIVSERIDASRQVLTDLCLELGNLPDTPGHERPVGKAVSRWLEDSGIPARIQTISEESINVIGIIRGIGDRTAGGRSLILNAHMDTQGVEPEGDENVRHQLRGAWLKDGLIYGRSLANDKAQVAAELIAARAIIDCGIILMEDLYVTAVAQETSAPINDVTVKNWSGVGPITSQVREGHGARWLVEHGVVADYALVVEVSNFTVTTAQAGYLRLRISVPGNIHYTPGISRSLGNSGSPNPFERAGHIVTELETWAREWEVSGREEYEGGVIVPRAQVYEITGSGPAWTEETDYCFIFFDIRLGPSARPTEIISSIRKCLEQTGIPIEINPYDYRRGYVADNVSHFLSALKTAHHSVLGGELPMAEPRMTSMWRDANAFNEAGIPAIGYGPPTQEEMGSGLAGAIRPIAVEDLLATSKVIALTALQVCGIAPNTTIEVK
ncbi:MAG: M20/M25/M40 family metallo-hydrolase [Pseudomonadota bacterium]|nr:M20/M25/M40 family metallo-hydrolase [Pseudomonadota bacterium]